MISTPAGRDYFLFRLNKNHKPVEQAVCRIILSSTPVTNVTKLYIFSGITIAVVVKLGSLE